jgi:hypothetical protein
VREKEFAGLGFNSKRLEKRFRRTMNTLAKQPGESIWSCSANRAETKAIYRMLGNERFDDAEILREHQTDCRGKRGIGGTGHSVAKLRYAWKDRRHRIYQRQNEGSKYS